MKPRAVAAVMAALGLVLAGCSGSPVENGEEDRLVVAQSSDILTMDPSVDTSPISLNAFKNVYDQLTDISADGDVAPQLASSWDSSADATTWTFTIRTNASFHDGTPVTVDDVIWTYKKIIADTKSPVNTYLSDVADIERVSDEQIRFKLKKPFAPFDRQVSLISIMPQKAYEKMGAAEFAKTPIGSGPFKFVSWQKDTQLELAAFDKYWKGAPAIKTLIFKPVPDESARQAGLISGELDVVPVLPPSSLQRVKSTKGVRVQQVASNRVLYLGFNATQAPLDDLKLRQAIDYAIDREAISRDLLKGLGKPIGQVVAPVTFGYDPNVAPAKYDPARAKALVAESKYDGRPIVFQYPNNRYAFGNEVAQAVAGYLGAAGIKVEMKGMEYSAFFPLWTGKKLSGIHMFAYGPSIMDAELPLGSLYASTSRGYWSNEQVDKLIEEQRAASNPKQRAELIGQIWRLSQQNVPYAFLYNEVQAYGISDRVKWEPRPDERLLFQQASIK
ncbi:ABC transporter substrate-binding protein [Micromonospora sp. NPDC005299]|uniref:ABC transporter substrate-binding protein n=1 Tax=Micromonospora sp. NPDC005299 TaxID=3364231 RepID=UPI00369E8038